MFDPDDWDCDIHFLDHSLYLHINFLTLSRNEFDWSFGKQNLALFFDLLISNSGIINITLDIMFISLTLLLFFLEDSKSLGLLKLNPIEVLEELLLVLVGNLDESLSLVLLSLSSLYLLAFMLGLLFLEPSEPLFFEANSLKFSILDVSLPLKICVTLLEQLAMLVLGHSIEAQSVLLFKS